jgi:hypothetical protein
VKNTLNVEGVHKYTTPLRERPFNLKGGLWFFSKKNILIPNVAEKKYSDFGGRKKKII